MGLLALVEHLRLFLYLPIYSHGVSVSEGLWHPSLFGSFSVRRPVRCWASIVNPVCCPLWRFSSNRGDGPLSLEVLLLQYRGGFASEECDQDFGQYSDLELVLEGSLGEVSLPGQRAHRYPPLDLHVLVLGRYLLHSHRDFHYLSLTPHLHFHSPFGLDLVHLPSLLLK